MQLHKAIASGLVIPRKSQEIMQEENPKRLGLRTLAEVQGDPLMMAQARQELKRVYLAFGRDEKETERELDQLLSRQTSITKENLDTIASCLYRELSKVFARVPANARPDKNFFYKAGANDREVEEVIPKKRKVSNYGHSVKKDRRKLAERMKRRK